MSLCNHVKAILCGEDPVLKLLDKRIRLFFCTMCKWYPKLPSSGIPTSMKTGTGKKSNLNDNLFGESRDNFMSCAKKEANRQGFAFFAKDLAIVSRSAWKALILMQTVHGQTVIDPILIEISNKND